MVDVSKWEDTQRMAQMVVDQFGHIDILVNNAGISQRGKAVSACGWEIPPGAVGPGDEGNPKRRVPVLQGGAALYEGKALGQDREHGLHKRHSVARVQQKIILFFVCIRGGGVYTTRQSIVAPWWGYLSSYEERMNRYHEREGGDK